MLMIKSVTIDNFKRFKVSNIKSLKLDINKSVQCIIGTNGSGKSSLLEQTKPIVPVKSDFNKGRRVIDIECDGDVYKLVSDFRHSGKSHGFFRNNEELNIGHGANIQQELIEKYLKISPIMLKILSCNIDICNMTLSRRKELFLQLNPIDISLFTKHHKRIRKRFNAVKSNLSMLYERKSELKQKKISNDEMTEIYKRKKYFEQEKFKCTKMIIKLQTLLEGIPNDIQNHNVDLPEVSNVIRQFNLLDAKYSNIDTLISNTKLKIDQLDENLSHENKSIDKLLSEIEEYNNHLRHTTQSEKIVIIDTKIKDNKIELDKLDKVHNDTNLDISTLQKLIDNKSIIIQEIIDWINVFREYDHQVILTKEEVDQIKNKLSEYNNKMYSSTNIIETIEKEKSNIESEILANKNIIIPDGCEKDICSLYKQYENGYKNRDIRYKEVLTQYNNHQNRITKYGKLISTMNDKLNSQTIIRKQLIDLDNILNRYAYLKQLIRDRINIKDILMREPYEFIKHVKELFFDLENITTKEMLSSEVNDLLKELTILKSSSNISLKFIRGILDKNKLKYEKKRRVYDYLERAKLGLNKKLSKYILYKSIYDKLISFENDLELNFENMKILKSKEFYELFLSDVLTYSNELDIELKSVLETIKNQEFIDERLKKEIIKPIKALSKDKDILDILEKSLRMISLEYTKDFLNKFIEISNFILSKILTYPMILDKIKTNDINFTFPITINDIKIPDINEISSGQKDMLKLSFNVALIIILDKVMYPLFIDEIDKTLDEVHKSRLIEVLNFLLDERIISQLFLINHHIILQEGFNGNVLVLDENNISTPEKYNENVIIKK